MGGKKADFLFPDLNLQDNTATSRICYEPTLIGNMGLRRCEIVWASSL